MFIVPLEKDGKIPSSRGCKQKYTPGSMMYSINHINKIKNIMEIKKTQFIFNLTVFSLSVF